MPKPTVIVENTQPRIRNLGGHCILMPGINQVDEDAWKEALKIQRVRDLLKLGLLKAPTPPAGGQPAAQGLAGMKAQDAIALVKKTVDKDLLEKWFDGEERKGVLEAIEEQLDAIAPAKASTPPAGGQE